MDYKKFEENMVFDNIKPVEAVAAVRETLRRIDGRLMDHGERVAYIANKLCEAGDIDLDQKTLFLLCVFHDIGAYETEEIDQMLKFESEYEHVQRHSIYGYLFLKYMTPLRDFAEAILYHHFPWERLSKVDTDLRDYAAMIHLADRIDVAMSLDNTSDGVSALVSQHKSHFKENYYNIAQECLMNNSILPHLLDGSYDDENLKLSSGLVHSALAAFEYLKMIVYTIDFRSDHTVTHTVNTVSIAVNIAVHFGLNDCEIEHIYVGALLHDIGKIAIPYSILESTGRLSDEEMAIMRTHVEETGALIKGVVPDDIYEISIRHHEKLDGSGYPFGLKAEEISFSERIVVVADIISALSSQRSYKDPFPREKTIAIISDMMKKQLDPQICQYVIDNYDLIIEDTDESRTRVINQYLHIREEYNKMIAMV